MVYHTDGIMRLGKETMLLYIGFMFQKAGPLATPPISYILFVGVVFMKTIWQPQLSLSYMNRLSSKVAKTTQLWLMEWLTE